MLHKLNILQKYIMSLKNELQHSLKREEYKKVLHEVKKQRKVLPIFTSIKPFNINDKITYDTLTNKDIIQIMHLFILQQFRYNINKNFIEKYKMLSDVIQLFGISELRLIKEHMNQQFIVPINEYGIRILYTQYTIGSIHDYVYEILQFIKEVKMFSAYKYFKEICLLLKIPNINISISRSQIQSSKEESVILLNEMSMLGYDILDYSLDKINKVMIYLTSQKELLLIQNTAFLYGLINLSKFSNTRVEDYNVNIGTIDFKIQPNEGFFHGFIPNLISCELLKVKYFCGENCHGNDAINRKEECVYQFFHRSDGRISGTGSSTIIFKGQSFFELNHEINLEMIGMIVKRMNISSKLQLCIFNKIIDIIKTYMQAYKPYLFTKMYIHITPKISLSQCVDNLLKIKVSPNTEKYCPQEYLDMRKHISKYLAQNEVNIQRFLTKFNSIHNFHHVIPLIHNFKCFAKDTTLNNLFLECGTLPECLSYDDKDISTYEGICMDHIEKNSMTIKDFIKYSGHKKSGITQHDIIAVILQLAYSIYILNYTLGIFHVDLHTENIYVEINNRIKTNVYLIAMGDSLKKIYDAYKESPYDIFNDCRDANEWEMKEDGIKGFMNILTKYHVKMIDFDRSYMGYGKFNATSRDYIKKLYGYHENDVSQPLWQLYLKHNNSELNEYNDIQSNQYTMYRHLPQSFSQAMYNENKLCGVDAVWKHSDVIDGDITWGEILAVRNTLEMTPSTQHKHDFTFVLGRICAFIGYEYEEEINKMHKEEPKYKERLEHIKKLWFPILKFLLNEKMEHTGEYDYKKLLPFGEKYNRSFFCERFDRSKIFPLLKTSKSPAELLFKLIFQNGNIVSDHIAQKKYPTKIGIMDTKIYAHHITQINNIKMIDYDTLTYPPGIKQNILSHLINFICKNDVELISKIVPQIIEKQQQNKCYDLLKQKLETNMTTIWGLQNV